MSEATERDEWDEYLRKCHISGSSSPQEPITVFVTPLLPIGSRSQGIALPATTDQFLKYINTILLPDGCPRLNQGTGDDVNLIVSIFLRSQSSTASTSLGMSSSRVVASLRPFWTAKVRAKTVWSAFFKAVAPKPSLGLWQSLRNARARPTWGFEFNLAFVMKDGVTWDELRDVMKKLLDIAGQETVLAIVGQKSYLFEYESPGGKLMVEGRNHQEWLMSTSTTTPVCHTIDKARAALATKPWAKTVGGINGVCPKGVDSLGATFVFENDLLCRVQIAGANWFFFDRFPCAPSLDPSRCGTDVTRLLFRWGGTVRNGQYYLGLHGSSVPTNPPPHVMPAPPHDPNRTLCDDLTMAPSSPCGCRQWRSFLGIDSNDPDTLSSP